MAANTTMGTTPAILAPYLAAEPPIKVQVSHTVANEVEEAELIGLAASARIRFADGFTQWADVWRIKPILRPFPALCEPLADGTVPAVEVAKLMLSRVIDPLQWNDASANEDEDRIEVQIPVAKSHTYPWILHIEPDYTITCYNSAGIDKEVVAWKAIDYLRSKHFAVGLEPGQYIEKVSSAAPIDKNTAL